MTPKNDGEYIDPQWKGLVKWGGVSLVVAGAIVIIFMIGIGVFQISLPLGPEEVLENPLIPTSLFIITAIGESLLFPGFLALYFALRDDGRAKMLIAVVAGAFSTVMFLVSRGVIVSVSQVSGSYRGAPMESLRAAYLAAVETALETQDVYSTMALIFLSIASIFTGCVMLKGKVFSRPIGVLVILAGVFTIFTPFAVNLGIPLAVSLVGLVLMLLWQVLVGVQLYRLGKHI